MAGISGCSGQLRVSDIPCSTGGSEESDYVTALTTEYGGRAIPSSLFVTARSDSIMEGEKKTMKEGGGDYCGSVEDRIELSKSHWSTLSGWSDDDEVAEVSNVEVFRALQMHPTWGGFFQTFGYDLIGGTYGSMGELVVGEKFAEGAQAELYVAQVTWWCPEGNEEDLRDGRRYLLKVFKKGTFLKHLQCQLPQGLLKFHAEEMENWASPSPKLFPRFYSSVYRGTLLKDGRFAFLIEKEHFDLRDLIERKMRSRSGEDGGPFSKEEVEFIMYDVALGVNFLHSHDIVHRDLKASNVLVRESKSGYECYVADYECSVGVVGTGFFRAPEILQACEGGETSPESKVFSKGVDAYSYGMTCYEILTGKLPFENHPLSGSSNLLIDHVINQHLGPKIPAYVEDWMCELLGVCWHSDPITRPSFEEILKLLLAKSLVCRQYEEKLLKQYGQNLKYCGLKIPNL